MADVFVISKSGKPLMPTHHLGKVRHMLADGRAIIVNRHPFAIQLTYDTTEYIQPIELCEDTGYEHIGISVKSEQREYLSEQRDLLTDEKKALETRKKYRRTRRSHKRYRAPRFHNRMASKKPGWLAPSLKNKAEQHIALIRNVVKVCPITDIYLELGEFDTQVIKAIQEGKPIPEGEWYQKGPMYGFTSMRAAVFARDNYTCQICKKGIKDNAILHEHHMYYWRGQHGNSMSELLTVCENCHTSANHAQGGTLWGLDKKVGWYASSAFMNTVRWYIYNQVKEELFNALVHITYGAATKIARQELKIDKSHVNDAFAMGNYHPGSRAITSFYQKKRRNNRCLEKFYDAKYIDIRNGKIKSGNELGCERTNRREKRMSDKNLRIYHGKQTTKGRRSIRKNHYAIQPNDIIQWNGSLYLAIGVHNNGTRVLLPFNGKHKSVALSKVQLVRYSNRAWTKIQ